MLLFLIISHNPAWWPTYGFDLANTHFSPLKGAMSSAPSITWEYTGAGYVERSPATAEIGATSALRPLSLATTREHSRL
jgi:hypothetical protein